MLDPIPDPGDPKTYGSYGSRSTTLVYKVYTVQVGTKGPTAKSEQNPEVKGMKTKSTEI
jgi:hypothetical protein